MCLFSGSRSTEFTMQRWDKKLLQWGKVKCSIQKLETCYLHILYYFNFLTYSEFMLYFNPVPGLFHFIGLQ